MMDFFSKCDLETTDLRIWSHLLKKSVMENIFVQCHRKKSEVITLVKKAKTNQLFKGTQIPSGYKKLS